ncbi:MAG: outer membrane beta-barrel protein [Candidatus Aminicenantes bacterium]|nr:outer membrane beta-barrel protein [Candidatus Aminicenantes bacterium]MDH5383277.1 outer membrane beta-barrel protein [Candidatus Aminicenantes bacterium]MDH5742505.1 outer membrane beta-barrel protein [Candidatus Aminicenantes bacterium]
MRKSMPLCVLLVLLSPLLVISQDQEETPQAQMARVIVDKANIHLESNPYSIVIDTVGRGTTVTLFRTGQKNKKWLYISYYSEKRTSQVTGFIDINLVEIINEKPKNPEPLEEANENTNEKLEQEEKSQAETESTAEKTQESQEEITQANAEKELTDMQKELAALRKRLKELEKESEKKPVEDVKKADMEQAREEAQRIEATAGKEESTQETEISQEQEKVQETEQEISEEKGDLQHEGKVEQEEKETTEPVKQLIEKIQEEQESVVEAQQIEKTEKKEKAEENKVITEKKEEAEEKMDTDLPEVLTKVSIKVRMANIRLMPSLKSAVIHQLPFGVELKPLGKSGNWHRVNLPPNPDGIILSGYIHGSIVNGTFEKIVPPPPEPEEFPEDKHEGLEEEPEPIKEIPPLVRTETPGLPIWIGAGAGYTMPSETSFGNGINFGLTLGYWITRYLAVELRVPYFQSDVTGSIGRLSTGQFKSISLTMSVQARYPIKDHIIPYVVGGGDYHLNKFTLDKEVVNSWNVLGFDIEENVNHTLGFHFGGGLDYFLFRNLALNLDVRYYTASLKGDRHLANTISQEETSGTINNIKLNSLQACISVKFFLNR